MAHGTTTALRTEMNIDIPKGLKQFSMAHGTVL